MPDQFLVVTQLTKRFKADDLPVIDHLSFEMPRGARVTLFAPTGSGKSTLINILTGLDRKYEGSFTLAARHPATVFQEPRLFPYMTVKENVFLPAKIRKTPIAPELMTAYERWLDVCELAAYTQHYPHQLSGGMKQKVALIRGFLTEPDFVMLDEPFKSLDPRSKQAIIRHILATYPEITLLFVTHTIEEVPLLTQSLLLFQTGRPERPNLAEFTTHRTGGSAWPPPLTEAIYD